MVTCFLPFSIPAQPADHWILQSPAPTTQSLLESFFLNGSLGYAVGDAGTVLKTHDGGSSWQKQTIETLQSLTSVCFLNADTGFAVGTGGVIFKTVDGGNHWVAKNSGLLTVFYRVRFLNWNLGFVVGANGGILKSTDGGESWIKQNSGFAGSVLDISIWSNDTAFAIGDGVKRTSDGGVTWVTCLLYNRPLHSISFPTHDMGVIVSGLYTRTDIFKSTDGGTTWIKDPNQYVPGVNNQPRLFSGHFISKDTGYAVGDTGTIFKTTNAAASWVPQSCDTRHTLNSVFFPVADTGYIVGDSGTVLKLVRNQTTGIEKGKYFSHLHADTQKLIFPSGFQWEKGGEPSYPIRSLIGATIPSQGHRPAGVRLLIK